MDNRVKDHEPLLALDGGPDGLDFYRKIINEAPKHLVSGGMLIFETGYDQAETVRKAMENSGKFYNTKIYKDYGGNFRGASGIKK